MFLGLRREEAARFSFLMSVPVMTAAAGLSLAEAAGEGMGGHEAAMFLAGSVSSGVVGGIFMGGWGEGTIFGGILGAVLGMLYDPRAATYTVPTRGGAEYPGNRDDYRP